jgi:hypothetical protein
MQNKNKSAEQIARDEISHWNNFKQYLQQACIQRNQVALGVAQIIV